MTGNGGPAGSNGGRSPPRPSTIELVIGGPIAPADVSALCGRVHTVLQWGRADVVLCDVGALVDPDAVTVDALARVQLTALRLGGRIQLRAACASLRDMLALAGLADVLPLASGVEPLRKPEEREQALRVQEEADPGDATV